MVDAAAQEQAQLYVITHFDWQREGQNTFDEQRARLLDMLAQLVKTMPAREGHNPTALHHLLLSGQTVILDDIASLRANLLTSLVIYNAGDRLGLGPWYVQVDGMMTSGESFVRNLLLARIDASKHGVKLMHTAYMPHSRQNVAQLPQILRNFEIDSVFMCVGTPQLDMPFIWCGLDGSDVLTMTYVETDTPQTALTTQREGQPDGPYLWLNAAYSLDTLRLNMNTDALDVPVKQGALQTYVDALRQRLPDNYRPRLKREIHLQPDDTLSGRFSARMGIKQANLRLEAELLHVAEPLLAISLTHGRVDYPKNQRALLEYGWRLLLQNQARDTASGAVSDDVQEESAIRTRRIEDNSRRVIESAMKALSGKRTPANVQRTAQKDIAETYLVVWNLHGHAVRQVVELQLTVPQGLHPAVLVAPSGEEASFHWDAETQTIGFLADAPSMGYIVYTLMLSRDKTAAFNQKRTVAARLIGSASGESLGISDGLLEWTHAGHRIHDLLGYYDGGDAGDVWRYQAPKPDVIMRGTLVDVVQVEATPTYERLYFRKRMRIAPGLQGGKSRVRGLRVLDIMTSATYYQDLPGIHFRTTFTNNADDHRLRVHIRMGIKSDTLYTDSAFAITPRSLRDGANGVQPMRRLAALYDDKRGLALLTRGLMEFEPIVEHNETTLALTLLRAVGWLDKAQGISAAGAQMQGELTTEFMLLPQEKGYNAAHLLQQAQAYQAPLRAYQYDEKPQNAKQSFLSMDTDRLVMTALKPPQDGTGWIVRLLNPNAGDVGAHLIPQGKVSRATRMTMAEQPVSDLTIEQNQVNVSLEPYQALTLMLGFA